MKWREPWSISMKQQPRFSLVGRDVLKGALIWSTLFTGLALIVNLGEDLNVQLERASHLWFAPALGVPLAVLLYVMGWLSPRQISSGPNGIVVVKGELISLIPWHAIKHYAFSRSAGLNVLHLTDVGGGSHMLFLSDKVHPKEVERELVKETGKHPNNSFNPMPLRGTG